MTTTKEGAMPNPFNDDMRQQITAMAIRIANEASEAEPKRIARHAEQLLRTSRRLDRVESSRG